LENYSWKQGYIRACSVKDILDKELQVFWIVTYNCLGMKTAWINLGIYQFNDIYIWYLYNSNGNFSFVFYFVYCL
jgi:hypothetical protein